MDTEVKEQQPQSGSDEENTTAQAVADKSEKKHPRRAKRREPRAKKDAASGAAPETLAAADGDAPEESHADGGAEKKKAAKGRKQGKRAKQHAPQQHDATAKDAEGSAEGKMETVEDIVKQSEARTKEKKNSEKEQQKPRPKRYIAFVGNLSYDTTKEDVERYFKCCTFDKVSNKKLGNLVGVRLLTKKGDNSSKGCGFVEFDAPLAFHKALKLHHTLFDGRQINVYLTAGGGGHSKKRLERIRLKNQDLDRERANYFKKHVAAKRKEGHTEGGEAKKPKVEANVPQSE